MSFERFFPNYDGPRIASRLEAAQFDLVASLATKKLGPDIQFRVVEPGFEPGTRRDRPVHAGFATARMKRMRAEDEVFARRAALGCVS